MALTLNPQQTQAIHTIKGPLLIIAGAGTGKTRVITHRIAEMTTRGIPPNNILALTFTNKAAREMQNRLTKLLPRPTHPKKHTRPTICTFHALSLHILRRHIHKLGYQPNFTIYNETDQLNLLQKILTRNNPNPQPKPDTPTLLNQLSRWRNRDPQTDPNPPNHTQLQHLQTQYTQALKTANALDFDDLILLTLKLLRTQPNLLQTYRQKHRYIMIDESQDTNHTQYQLTHLLAQKHRNLCLVGDDDQSIYSWRGAQPTNLHNHTKHYPETKTIKLQQNYRSTNTILQAANHLIQNNTQRQPKNLYSKNGQGPPIQLTIHPDDQDEAQTITQQIQHQHLTQNTPYTHHAILFRTNQQARPIETALRAAQIPYRLIGTRSYYDRREIKDLLAYLKTILNPNDDNNLLRILNTPPRAITPKTTQTLLNHAHQHNQTLHQTIQQTLQTNNTHTPAARRGLTQLTQLIQQQQQTLQTPNLNLTQWTQQLLQQTNYHNHLRQTEKDPTAAQTRIQNTLDLATQLTQPNQKTTPNQTPAQQLQQQLDQLTLDTQHHHQKDKPTKTDQLTLITIHSAKGLEYPHIHLIGLEQNILPHTHSQQNNHTLQEERRLLYVAITRAIQTLHISYCQTRRHHRKTHPTQPSQFLDEIPPHLIQTQQDQTPINPQQAQTNFQALKTHLLQQT